MTAVSSPVPTFPLLFGREADLSGGDVTPPEAGKIPDYAWQYAVGKRETGTGERIKIPVDNSEFSTLSTVLSTGVIHKDTGLWISTFGFT